MKKIISLVFLFSITAYAQQDNLLADLSPTDHKDVVNLNLPLGDGPAPTVDQAVYVPVNHYKQDQIKKSQFLLGGGISADLSGKTGTDLIFKGKQDPQTDKVSVFGSGRVEYNALIGINPAFKFGVAIDKNNKSIGIALAADSIEVGDEGYVSFSPELFLSAATNIGKDGSSLSCSVNLSPVDISLGMHTLDASKIGYSLMELDPKYQSGICYSAGVDVDADINTPNGKGEVQIEGYCTYYSRKYSYQEAPLPADKLTYVNTGLVIKYRIFGPLGVFTNIEFTNFCYNDHVAAVDKKSYVFGKGGIFLKLLNE